MHSVIETHSFRRSCLAAGVTEAERFAIVDLLAADPRAGDLMEGTGGARKLRFAAKGKGKSGGYRVITFFAAQDVPVFLLDIFAKGDKVNLSKAERNELKTVLAELADQWRASASAKLNAILAKTRK